MVYATSAELAAELPADLVLPTDADRLLRRASEHIDSLLFRGGAYYDATDIKVIAALKTATCLQASYWIETGDEQGLVTDSTNASISGGPTFGGVARTAPMALRILRMAVDTQGVPLLQGYYLVG